MTEHRKIRYVSSSQTTCIRNAGSNYLNYFCFYSKNSLIFNFLFWVFFKLFFLLIFYFCIKLSHFCGEIFTVRKHFRWILSFQKSTKFQICFVLFELVYETGAALTLMFTRNLLAFCLLLCSIFFLFSSGHFCCSLTNSAPIFSTLIGIFVTAPRPAFENLWEPMEEASGNRTWCLPIRSAFNFSAKCQNI